MDKRAKKEKKKDAGILRPKEKVFKVWLIEIRKSPF